MQGEDSRATAMTNAHRDNDLAVSRQSGIEDILIDELLCMPVQQSNYKICRCRPMHTEPERNSQ